LNDTGRVGGWARDGSRREDARWQSRLSRTSPSQTATGSGTARRPRSASGKWAGAEDEPNGKYRDAHVWFDSGSKDNFTAYKLLIADVVDGQLAAVPRGIMAAGNVMQGSRGGVDLPQSDINRVKSHLAKYYKKMGEEAPWQRD
jgi:hypothetical protein